MALHPLRMRLIYFSTSSMFATIVLFPLVFVFRSPLDSNDFLRLLQQALPVFVGFLVAAIGFAFGTRKDFRIRYDKYQIISFILVCSFAFYWAGIVAITGIYLWSHSRFAELGAGYNKDFLFTGVSLLISALTGMAGLIATKIFLEEGASRTEQVTGSVVHGNEQN
jgi:hypothetical protein